MCPLPLTAFQSLCEVGILGKTYLETGVVLYKSYLIPGLFLEEEATHILFPLLIYDRELLLLMALVLQNQKSVCVGGKKMPRSLFQPGTSHKLQLFGVQCWCAVRSLAQGAAWQAGSLPWSRRVGKVSDILGQILQVRSMETVWDKSSLCHSLKATQIPQDCERVNSLAYF